MLARDIVKRQRVSLDTRTPLLAPDGTTTGLAITLFAVPGKVPLYMESTTEVPPITVGEATVGVGISDAAHSAYFIPGCARMTPELAARLHGAKLVFFDGTLWRDDEMITSGAGTKTGSRMGHMSLSGPSGTIAAFAPLDVKRRIFVHINNSNPVLMADAPERAQTQAAGWEVGYDGMEVTL